jgi:hypothetical protein
VTGGRGRRPKIKGERQDTQSERGKGDTAEETELRDKGEIAGMRQRGRDREKEKEQRGRCRREIQEAKDREGDTEWRREEEQ